MQYLILAQNMVLLDRKWSTPCWYYLRISPKIKCNSFENTFKQFSWMTIAALDWNLTKACWYGSNWQNDLALNKHLELKSKSMLNSVTDQLTACSIQFKAMWSARQHFTKNWGFQTKKCTKSPIPVIDILATGSITTKFWTCHDSKALHVQKFIVIGSLKF